LTELATPLADGFIGHHDAAGEQQLFHVAVAEAEAAIEPDRVADDLDRKAVIFIAVDGWYGHAPSISHWLGTGQVALNKLTMPVQYTWGPLERVTG
jgi:hypothetical protein